MNYADSPCPFCGQKAGIPEGHSVYCESCGAKGPTGHDQEHGISLWSMKQSVFDKDTDLIRNPTSLHFLVNGINRRVVAAIGLGDRQEAERLCSLADAIEAAFQEITE